MSNVLKEKLASLNRYLSTMQDKLASPIPKKHEKYAREYKEFLHREVSMVKSKIDALRLDVPGEKK